MQPLSENLSQIDRKTLHLIFRAIRASFKRSEAYQKTKNAYLAFEVGSRGGKRWYCAICGGTNTEVELDHYPEPVCAVDREWFSYSVDEFYRNVFHLPCRVLCKGCHKAETKIQNDTRRSLRKRVK